MPPQARTDIVSVQYLRAGAALAVVFFHANSISQEYFGNSWCRFGAAGVDVFFVVSGLIMWLTASGQNSPVEFMRNRIIRIVPLYWGMTLLLFAGWTLAKTAPPFADLLKSLLFVPHVSMRTGEINPLLIVGWTLNFEMFFYAVFAAVLCFNKRWRGPLLFAALISMVSAGLFLLPAAGPVQTVYTAPLLIEFVMGCLIGILFQRRLMPRRFVGASIGLVGIILLIGADGSAADLGAARLFYWGLPAFLIVIGTISFEPVKKRQSILMLLGAASYSIYLVHTTVIAFFKDLFVAVAGPAVTNVSAFIFVASVVSVCVGIFVYSSVESPVHALLKKKKTSRDSRLPTFKHVNDI